jgi:replicative DNA helicase
LWWRKGRETTETAEGQARAWFGQHGWRLPPDELRAGLEERGADVDLIIELIDEGADRRREQEAATRRSSRPHRPVRRCPAGAVPPQNLEAEESVLGAMMLAPGAIVRARDVLGDTGRDFYRDSHARIYLAALALHDRGEPVDPITLTAEISGARRSRPGRRPRPPARARRTGARVGERRALRPDRASGGHAAWPDPDGRRGRAARLGPGGRRRHARRPGPAMVGELEERVTPADESHLVGGGDFILDVPEGDAAVWGDQGSIGWATGEGLMLCGPQGVGKTTLMQQLALARAGLLSRLLGLPVAVDERPILYVAADRPRQAARSLARMVDEHNRADLNERVQVWRGPLPFLLNEQPTALARLCERLGVGTVFLDSVKDVAVRISEDEPAAKFNMAVQHCLAAGVEVVCAHHQRKQQPGAPKPKTLADVYGNTWLTAGMGSVIVLWGEAGDPIVELSHIKQPMEELGPWSIRHNHDRGITLRHDTVSLEELLRRAGDHGLTAKTAAGMLRQTETPSPNEIEKADGSSRSSSTAATPAKSQANPATTSTRPAGTPPHPREVNVSRKQAKKQGA